MKNDLTPDNEASLLARGARIVSGRVSLSVQRIDGVRCFVIDAPTGIERLPVDLTTLERLNAHWLGFIANNPPPRQRPVVRSGWDADRVVTGRSGQTYHPDAAPAWDFEGNDDDD